MQLNAELLYNKNYIRMLNREVVMAFHILMVEDDSQICEVVEDYFTEKSEGELEIEFAADGDTVLGCKNS